MKKLNNAEERRLLVKTHLQQLQVTRLADLGCGTGSFIRYLVNGKSFDLIVGIDISWEELKKAHLQVKPSLYDNLTKSDSPQSVLLFQGDLLQESVYSVFNELKIEAVTLIEVIQHVQLESTRPIMQSIFERIKPRVVIVTTPNEDFNHFFGLSEDELRHPDHKYEFTQKEFREWAVELAERFQYSVSFTGTHYEVDEYPEAIHQICSQVAIFEKLTLQISKNGSNSSEQPLLSTENHGAKQLEISVTSAKPFVEITYPYKTADGGSVAAEEICYQTDSSEELRSLELPDSFYWKEDDE